MGSDATPGSKNRSKTDPEDSRDTVFGKSDGTRVIYIRR